ncbi:MAG: baseplate J/gp47 family protein [Desulfuromonas sp.]|nr:baseplate J/gp47 family protein [Desulfuromonas sp.]
MSETAIDLSQLPAPQVVEPPAYETILAAMLADLQARDPGFDALVESDPAYRILEVTAYRELLIRQRVNDAARAVMLPYAEGADLGNLAALYNVSRLLIDAGDPDAVPPIAATYESDEALRRRAQLAPEAITTAGSTGSYVFHGLSASVLVKDVAIASPVPGQVQVTVLSTEADGIPDQALLDMVEAALNIETVRPLTDQVTVQAATITNYTIDATLYVYPGPDAEVVRQAAQDAVTQYTIDHHALGYDITLSGLYAALHQPGAQRVELASPVENLTIAATAAAYCTAIIVTTGGTDE